MMKKWWIIPYNEDFIDAIYSHDEAQNLEESPLDCLRILMPLNLSLNVTVI